MSFDRAPFLVIWEITQACELACRHCRASAMPGPFPGELSTDEGRRLIDQVAEMGAKVLVLSGGDPASRPDLCDLVRHGKSRGLRMATVPAATSRLTLPLVRDLGRAGLDQIAFSLDFPDAARHDGFRGSPGAFQRTLAAVGWAHECGIPAQINSCVWAESLPFLPETAARVEEMGIVFWEVFFLVPVGRGTLLPGLSAEQCEETFAVLHRAQAKKKFIVKVTEAPHYRRYLAQRRDREMRPVEGKGEPGTPAVPPEPRRPANARHPESIELASRGVNAGNGFCFVSHQGEVFPSGFLPVSAGNVRRAPLAAIYRDSDLFRSLRDPNRLKGRCGRCPYRSLCGGSRSRAYALTGDWLETDPWCGYEPPERGGIREDP